MIGKRLEGKTAIVSGAGQGIGRAIALRLAHEGARVVVNDIDPKLADDIAGQIAAAGSKAATCAGDVSAADFGERFVATALREFGSLDIIVNNAGYTWDNVVQKMSDEQFQAMLDVHTIAPFRILRAAAEHFRACAGKERTAGAEVFRKVVNISSTSGTRGNAGQINYSAAKAAVIGMTKTMAQEWGRYRVNVNCVAFGLIETRLSQAVQGEKVQVAIGERVVPMGVPAEKLKAVPMMIPLGRAGTVDEAAAAVYFFCSSDSNYVSGEVLTCAGGI